MATSIFRVATKARTIAESRRCIYSRSRMQDNSIFQISKQSTVRLRGSRFISSWKELGDVNKQVQTLSTAFEEIVLGEALCDNHQDKLAFVFDHKDGKGRPSLSCFLSCLQTNKKKLGCYLTKRKFFVFFFKLTLPLSFPMISICVSLKKKNGFIGIDHGFTVTELSFAELSEKSAKIANALRNVGIGKGDIVGCSLHKSLEMVATIVACARIGAVYTPLFPSFSIAEVHFSLF